MKILVTLTLLFVSVFALAALRGAPFLPEADKRMSDAEVSAAAVAARVTQLESYDSTDSYAAASGILGLKVAVGRLNCSVSSDCSIGNHSMGVALPANAVIIKDFMHINARFVDAGPGSLQISCEDTGNILASGDITGSLKNTVLSGVSSGDVSVMKSDIAASCDVTAAVGGAQPSSGDLSLFIQYVVHP